MIKTLDETVCTMQKPGYRSLIVSDNDDFLFDPHGQNVIRTSSKESLTSLLSRLEKAENQKKASCKVNERGIDCVVIDPSIKTRRLQKLYQLQKLRQQRRVLRVAVIERIENLQSVNGTYDSDVDFVAIHLLHSDFNGQVKRVKQRFCTSQKNDMQQKIDKCLSGKIAKKNGWFITCAKESFCNIEYLSESTTSVDVDQIDDMNAALECACDEQECSNEDQIIFDVEAQINSEQKAEVCEEGYICTSFNGAVEEQIQEEEEEEEMQDSFYAENAEEVENVEDVEEIEDVEEEESCGKAQEEEEISGEESSYEESSTEESSSEESSSDESSSEESSSDESSSKESSSDESSSEESSSEEAENSSEEISQDEQTCSDEEEEEETSAKEEEEEEEESSSSEKEEEESSSSSEEESSNEEESIGKEFIVENPLYTAAAEKNIDDIAYEIAMEKIDNLIEQLQKTRAAAKLAKDSKKHGWLAWLWTASK